MINYEYSNAIITLAAKRFRENVLFSLLNGNGIGIDLINIIRLIFLYRYFITGEF